MPKSVIWKCSVKRYSKKLAKFTGKPVLESHFNMRSQTPAQMFSCEFCKIFKITYFPKHLGVVASETYTFCCSVVSVSWKQIIETMIGS